MTTAYSYIRMSTQQQLKGDSLRRQTERAIQYCKTHNLHLDDTLKLTDIGLSAYDGSNLRKGTLGKFLYTVNEGKIEKGSVLVVESLDRLSRANPQKALSLFLEILSAGICIVTLIDGRTFHPDSVDPMELFLSLTLMIRANEESATKADRQKHSWNNKRKYASQRNLSKICPGWLRPRPDAKGFDEIPERVAVVRWMFNAATEAGMGALRILESLNKNKTPTWGRSTHWSTSTVKKILKNQAVLGRLQPCTKVAGKRIPTGEIIEGYFPVIITADLFHLCQHKIELRRVGGGGNVGAHVSNLFTKVAKCGHCHQPMHSLNKGRKGGQVLQCSTTKKGAGCINVTWRYDDFEKTVLAYLREIDIRALTGEFIHRDELSTLNVSIRSERGRLLEAQKRRQNIFDRLMGDNPTAFVRDSFAQAENEVAEISAGIALLESKEVELKGQNLAFVESGHEMDALIAQVQDSDLDKSATLRARIQSAIRDVVKSIDVYPGGHVMLPEKLASVYPQIMTDLNFSTQDNRHLVDDIKAYNMPRKERRSMILRFHDGGYRIVAPSFDDPTRFEVMGELSGGRRSANIFTTFPDDANLTEIHPTLSGQPAKDEP